MNLPQASLIGKNGSLCVLALTNELADYCRAELLKCIPVDSDKAKHKYNMDLILYICRVIEAAFSKKQNAALGKVDKKAMFFEIFRKVMVAPLTEEDVRIVSQIVEALHSAGKIRMASLWKRVRLMIGDVIKSAKN